VTITNYENNLLDMNPQGGRPRETRAGAPPPIDVAEFRAPLEAWLHERAHQLARTVDGIGTLDEEMSQLARVKGLLFEAGWMQWGWPERVGGAGGTSLFRSALGEALCDRDLVLLGYFSMTEVLPPTIVDFGSPSVAATCVPRLLSGAEVWCQSFPQPGTGSDLSSLSCRATPEGDR